MSGLRLATSRPLAERREPCLAAKRQPRATKSREVDLRPAPYLIRQRTFWKSSRAFVRNEIEWRLNKSSLRVAITTLWRNRLSSIRFSALPYHSNSYFTLLSGLVSAAGRGLLPFISHIGMCHHKGRVFAPFWPEIGFWTGIGYSFRLPACRRLLFPFARATKEIGDVCTQARFSRELQDCMNVFIDRFNSQNVRMDFHCRVIFQCMKCRA